MTRVQTCALPIFDCGRRRGHSFRRRHCHGTRLRRGVDEYRHCRRSGTGADGGSDETCRAGGTTSIHGWAHAAEALCDSQFAAGRRSEIRTRWWRAGRPRPADGETPTAPAEKRRAATRAALFASVGFVGPTASSRFPRESCRRRCARSRQRDVHSAP